MAKRLSEMIVLANGAKPIYFVVRGNEGIVLANFRDEFVVWYFYSSDIADNKSGVFCETGNYFRSNELNEATERFKERSMYFMGWGE